MSTNCMNEAWLAWVNLDTRTNSTDEIINPIVLHASGIIFFRVQRFKNIITRLDFSAVFKQIFNEIKLQW